MLAKVVVPQPLLADGGVELIGEINDAQQPEFLSGAIGLLMPIDWPEPFGLVMIEAMACGTPVIAFNRGSVPEIVDPRTHLLGPDTDLIENFPDHQPHRVWTLDDVLGFPWRSVHHP